MSIDIAPEHQKLIDAAIRSGAYSNADQVIGRALEVLSAEDEWLQAHSRTIDEKIGRGLAQLDRGEGIPGDQARAVLQERKAAFLEQEPRHHP
jgi:antitoxin ParD1/3/4